MARLEEKRDVGRSSNAAPFGALGGNLFAKGSNRIREGLPAYVQMHEACSLVAPTPYR